MIWTTTPWTLPANLGIALHPEFEYAAIDTGSDVLIVAEGLREKFLADTGLKGSKLASFKGTDFERLKAVHPFMLGKDGNPRRSLLILGEHVTLEAGTGAVHTAPGHGVDDYRVGRKYGLDVLAPVDQYGKFTDEVPLWKGTKVFQANEPIIKHLEQTGHLIKMTEISHSYPHCWRCNKPVIFRATPQWFIGMDGPTQLRKRRSSRSTKSSGSPRGASTASLGYGRRGAPTGASRASASGACRSPSSTAKNARSPSPRRTASSTSQAYSTSTARTSGTSGPPTSS